MSVPTELQLVSIIIPFRDEVSLLEACVSSILEKTRYQDYEIILVNNDSVHKDTKAYIQNISENEKVIIVEYNKPFNFSAINNFAVSEAKGEYIVFLNNDTEVISPEWLGEMLRTFERNEKIGAVGAKLLYANNTIQHVGVEPKNGDLENVFRKEKNFSDKEREYNKTKKIFAVTAACMMTKRELFLEVGGFDEKNLAVAYNDIDYCLKLQKKGYETWICPQSVLYHYESASRGKDIWKRFLQRKRYKEFAKEREFFLMKWNI